MVTQRSGLFLSVAVTVVIWLLVGGGVTSNLLVFMLFALTGSWLLGFVLANGGWATWGEQPPLTKFAIAFFCLMPLLQCIPLPPAVWQALPGRETSVRTLALVGAAQSWHPITLTFDATFRTFLMSIWLLGLLLAVMRLSTTELKALFVLLLAMGGLHLLIGIVQVATGGRFLFFDVPNINFLLGFFANKNHSGLFIALLFPIAYIALYGERGWNRSRLPLVVVGSLVLFATLILTFSRAGLFFGALALAFLLLLSFEGRLGKSGRYAAFAGLGIVALLAILASTDVATRSLGRFAGVGTDPRWLFWTWSKQLIPVYFPVGSGIGSFVEVFKVLEHLSWVKPTYLNHAHNEYIEQLIEVGIAAPILWILVLGMVVGPLRSAWRDRARTQGRIAVLGGLMVLLFFLHSAFDYPLRRPSLDVVFVIALAALLRRRTDRKTIA
jgi:O-antigen ligase